MRALVFCLVLLGFTAAARANDGYAEIGIGGLELHNTDAVSMDSEDLYISPTEIRVDYLMTNRTGQHVDALVVFPLPDLDLASEAESARGSIDLARNLKFKTTVDGKAFPITLVQKAFVGEKDVTAAVQAAGLSLGGTEDDFQQKVRQLQPAALQNLIALGALPKATDTAGNEVPYDANFFVYPQWILKPYVQRQQVFPAGKTLKVSHRYVPLTGASVEGGVNYTEARFKELTDEYRADFEKELARHCMDDAFIAAYRKRVAAKGGRLGNPVWIRYILKSGATWKGPIKNFRMVVDKGKPDSLVSFCAEGVKKISPTQFEVRKKDYEPTEDVDVLVVGWD